MRIVFSAAVMDLCHEGHLNLLKEMRHYAGKGKVIVVLHDDKNIFETKGKIPIQNLKQRVRNLYITGLVDKVYTVKSYDELSKRFLKIIKKYKKHDLYFMRGDDWEDFPAKQTLIHNDIPIRYVVYTKGVSSTSIRKELTL